MADQGGRRRDAAEERRSRRPAAAERTSGFAHTPVLLDEVLEYLQPRPGGVFVDATVGGGGHARAILEALAPGGHLVALDRDPEALDAARGILLPLATGLGVRLDFVHSNYAALDARLDELGLGLVDGVLFDLGVSSHQLDTPERGFSYRADAPLDMRMDPTQGTTAYHLVNGLSEDELTDLIRRFGEERWARRIANFIVCHRQERGLIETTGELVEIIKAAVPRTARRDGPHPARRTFQALRIGVNNELGSLEAALRAACFRLRAGGRVVVLSFHSLEDRTAKTVFRELARGCTCPPEWPVCRCGKQPEIHPLVGRPLQATAGELEANPRSRSAKLRAAERVRTPALPSGGSERGPSILRCAAWDGVHAAWPPVPSLAETLYPSRRRSVLHLRGEE